MSILEEKFGGQGDYAPGSQSIDGVRAVVHSFRKGAMAMVTRFQVGRMTSILKGMSDTQLDSIGIQRSEIETYARDLINPGKKGEGTNTGGAM